MPKTIFDILFGAAACSLIASSPFHIFIFMLTRIARLHVSRVRCRVVYYVSYILRMSTVVFLYFHFHKLQPPSAEQAMISKTLIITFRYTLALIYSSNRHARIRSNAMKTTEQYTMNCNCLLHLFKSLQQRVNACSFARVF